MAKLFVELAGPEGTEVLQGSFLDDSEHWPRCVKSTNGKHYDEIKLDGLQCIRLPADYSGKPSLVQIEEHCKVANESQSFYISVSRKQWLRTTITLDKPRNIFISRIQRRGKANPIIHSNVIPRQAYLNSACLYPQHCTRGFFQAADITEASGIADKPDTLCRISCERCTLANRLKSQEDAKSEAKLFWYLESKEVQLLEDLAPGITGVPIYKILWRKGVFVRKLFYCEGSKQNPLLKRELEVALNVSHPNLVLYFGCSTWNSSGSERCLFMELLEFDLNRFLVETARLNEATSFSFQDRLDVLLQVAQAMNHLHEMNFLHGDLKPQNIFMSCFESAHSGVQYYLVKVGDFGCAQRVDSSGATVDPFDFGIGSFRYTAPEVLRCLKHGGAALPEHPQKMDVYSFGVVAYQVLTRVTNLYQDLSPSQIKEGVIQGTLRPDFSETLHGDSSALLPFIKSCWAQNPGDRPSFKECEEFLSSIKENNKLQEYNAKRKHQYIDEVLSKPMKKLCFSNKDSIGTVCLHCKTLQLSASCIASF